MDGGVGSECGGCLVVLVGFGTGGREGGRSHLDMAMGIFGFICFPFHFISFLSIQFHSIPSFLILSFLEKRKKAREMGIDK